MKNLNKEELLQKLIDLGIIKTPDLFKELTNEALIELIEVYQVREEVEKQKFEDDYIKVLKEMSSEDRAEEIAERLHKAIVEKRRTEQKNNELISKVKSAAA